MKIFVPTLSIGMLAVICAITGMGIGLSVCRTVVRAHGGHIRGENRTEGGARFTVELPLDKEIQQEVDSYEDQG